MCLCAYMCGDTCTTVCMPWLVNRGQRAALWSQLFTSCFVLGSGGIKLRLLGLYSKRFCLWSHLDGSDFVMVVGNGLFCSSFWPQTHDSPTSAC